MGKISSVSIQGFKSIIDETIEFGQLNVFIGTNGSGKSNVLEAIGTLSVALSGRIDYPALAAKGVRLSSPEIFRSSFKHLKRKRTLDLGVVFDNLRYRATISCISQELDRDPWYYVTESIWRRVAQHEKKVAGRSPHGIGIARLDSEAKSSIRSNQSIALTVEALGLLRKEETANLDALRGFAIFSPSTPILRGVAADESSAGALGLYGGGMATALHDVLRTNDRNRVAQFFSLLDWYQSIGTISPNLTIQSSYVHSASRVVRFRDKFMKANFNDLTAYDVSEGALYVLFMLLLITHPKSPSIFAVDNIDNYLNPGAIRKMMRHVDDTLKAYPNKQIFLTTHHPSALDAIDLFDERHRLFVVKRGEHGGTKLERIRPPIGMTRDLWEQKYGSMRLSEVWLSGAIGGMTSDNF